MSKPPFTVIEESAPFGQEQFEALLNELIPKPVPLTRKDVETAVQYAAAEYQRRKGTKVRPQ